MSIIENFSLDYIKNLSQNDAKEYLTKYFVPLTDGNHAFYINGKFEIYETKIIKSTYFNRMSKELNEYYFKNFTALKTITYQLNKDLFIDGNKINLCPKIKAVKTKSYHEYDDKTKQGVDEMLQFIKEVLASDNELSYNYIIKWLANMLQGNKNDSSLYLKGPQGIGKSTLFEFLKNFVIGLDLLLETGSEPLKSQFNSILAGKLLVVFEELENFSSNEWNAISSRLKRYTTSETYTIEEKHVKQFQTQNINNYIINSNNDAIKDDEGRRYFILDVSTKYMKNTDYFGKLRKNCFNNFVGEAFYTYMLEVDTKGFTPQNYPDTQSKLNSYAKRLNDAYQFIKEQFILRNIDLNHTTKELYDLYKQFSENRGNKKLDKTSFSEKLSQVGIIYKKTNGNTCYKYSVEYLTEIANKHKWIHELDEFSTNEENDAVYENNIIEEKDNEIKRLMDIITNQSVEIDLLKKQIEELNKPKTVKKYFKVVKKPKKENIKMTIEEQEDNQEPENDLFTDF
jgi:hypothetical protein